MNSTFALTHKKAQEQKMTEKLNNLTEKNGSFLPLCLNVNRCEPGVHSYQFHSIQSATSPILKSLVPVVQLVGGVSFTVLMERG